MGVRPMREEARGGCQSSCVMWYVGVSMRARHAWRRPKAVKAGRCAAVIELHWPLAAAGQGGRAAARRNNRSMRYAANDA